jgi:hypothetical protein
MTAIDSAPRFMSSGAHASIRGFYFVQTDAKDKGIGALATVTIRNNASGNFDALTVRKFKRSDESNVTTADIKKRAARHTLNRHCFFYLRNHRPECKDYILGRGLIDNQIAHNDLSLKKLKQGTQR